MADKPLLRRLPDWLIYLGVAALLAPNLATACEECGGKGKAVWALRENEPKASELHPNARIVEYTLDIAETTLSPAGRPVRVLTLMRGLSVEFLGRYTMNEIETEGRSDEDREGLSLNLRAVYRLTPTMSVIASYTFFNQTADRSADEFDRNRVFLGLQYAYPINVD